MFKVVSCAWAGPFVFGFLLFFKRLLFLIGTAEHNVGQVFFWSRRFEADEGEGQHPSDDNMAFVVENFKELLMAFSKKT